MGNGATGTGSLRVTIASDNTAFSVNSTLTAETTKVIGTVRTLGNAGAITDGVVTAAASPANGQMQLGIYNSTEPSPTTGQSVGIQLDSKGRTRGVIMDAAGNTRGANVDANNNVQVANAAETTKVIGTVRVLGNAGAAFDAATSAAVPANAVYTGVRNSAGLSGQIGCTDTAVYDASTSGNTELVALTSNQVIYVCGYTIFSAGTVNVRLVTGTGTACATGEASVTPAFQLTSQTGAVDGSPVYRGLKSATSGALCLETSGAVAVQALVYYTKFQP